MKIIVLIGSGKWGQKYISTIANIHNVKLFVANRSNWKMLIDEHPDGVIVCTPPESHVEIADYSLSRGIPTMIEKPLSLSLIEARQLNKYQIPVLVNHIHLFSQGYQNIKEIVKNKQISSIYSIGLGTNPIRDYSSLWDYGPHDLAMILDLLQKMPNDIKISKHQYFDMFHIELSFSNCKTYSTIGIQPIGKYRSLYVETDGICVSYDDTRRPDYHVSPLLNAINIFIQAMSGYVDDRLGLDLSMKILEVLEDCQNRLF